MEEKKKDKLVKLLNLVSSDSDGEALTAARLAVKLMKESGEDWAGLLGAEAGNPKDLKNAYSKGYRAGFEKGHGARFTHRAQQAPPPPRPRHGNMVHDRRRITKVFEDFFSTWESLSEIEKAVIAESVQFFNTNQCLYLRDYDRLKGIAKKYWDVVYD
jgi:hypothetical protein